MGALSLNMFMSCQSECDGGAANITTKIAKRQKTQKKIPFCVFCDFANFGVNPSIVDCRLLLRYAMDRPEPPDQIHAIDPDDLTISEYLP
jgi:hypothetical protein